MTTPTQRIHTIFGAGQVGLKLADELLARGHTVRIVRRGPAMAQRERLVWMSGDITDHRFADEAARGADVLYNCVNPTDYTRWHGVIEPLMRAVAGAATRAQAKLVVLDCLYMIGVPATSPFDEDTPMQPCSPKGELRKQLFEELLAAHRRGDVRVTWGRASDYFGPATPSSVLLHPRSLARLRAGKPVELLGDPDQPHAYSYTPDVARGLAALGEHDEAMGKVFHLPAVWTGTTRELLLRFGAAAGTSGALWRMPGWATATIGVFSPLVRAMREMVYQWEVPYVIDDRRIRTAFGVEATPIDRAIAATLAARAEA